MSRDSDNAVITALLMLATIVAIVGIVFGYKHCQAVDERVEQCMASGNHSAAECRAAFRVGGDR